MILKLKLPERKEPTVKIGEAIEVPTHRVASVFNGGFNECLEQVQSLNPERDIDVEALAKEMFEICYYPEPEKWEEQDGSTKSRWEMNAQIIFANAHLWIKEKEKG